MKSQRALSMPLTPAFRCTWLASVILPLAATRSAQALPGPSDALLATLGSVGHPCHGNCR